MSYFFIGNSIFRRGGGQVWSTYWATRTPSDLVLTITGDTSLKVDWSDAADEADGIKIYNDDVLADTVAFGVGTSTLTVVLNSEHTIKVVAYKGANESNAITSTITWSHWMQYSYTDKINTHTTWTTAQKALILGRLQEDYVVTTFGPSGLNKSACDFFIFFQTFATAKTTSTTTKTGATLRWNYGGGNIYDANNMPAQVSTTEITVTSTDGFGAVTRFTFASGQFRENIPYFPYFFPNITSFQLNGGTRASGTRLKGDITDWGFWNSTMTVFVMTEHDITGDLSSWVIPNGMRSPNLSGNTYLTGDTPSFSATWNGSGASAPNFSNCRFTGIGGTSFPYTRAFTLNLSNNCFSTTEISDFIARMNTWYAAHAPQNISTIDVTGTCNGTILGGDANTDLVTLKATFVTAGYTFTPTYNSDTYLLTPLDNPTLVVTMDDDFITDYSKILPMLNARGKAGVSFRYGQWIDGHQTITEVNALIAAGWGIEAHPVFAPDVDEPTARDTMVALQTFFTNNSIPMFNHCAYSGGVYNATVQALITDYCDTARTIGQWTSPSNTTNRGSLIYKDNDVTALYSISCDPITATDVVGIKDRMDVAKIKSAGMIIYFHYVTDADVVLIAQLVDYAIAQGFDVVTMDGLYSKMTA